MTQSRVVALSKPSDGLTARLALIDGATGSLELQYYLWDSDAVGYLLLSRLIAAADRGVAVRLLVDDLKMTSRTRSIAGLCLHPNLEVRVFNPFDARSGPVAQGVEFIRRFGILDERMHNKLLVADNTKAIFGGRNIAVDHFGLGERFNLVDFDLMLYGADASDLARVFSTYWESPSVVVAEALDAKVAAADFGETRSLVAKELEAQAPLLTTVLAEADGWHDPMDSAGIPLDVGAMSVVADNPQIVQDTRPDQVIAALQGAVADAERDLVVSSPFFVPTDSDVRWYGQIVDRGVRLRVLTNSLASNQGTISNSGLKRQRQAMIEAGVQLRELRTDAADKPEWETKPQVARYLGLHAKLYVIDSKSVFLGSVNLDPRSKRVNTEMGVLIHNVALAEAISGALVRLMTPGNAWQVEVGPSNQLQWRSDTETRTRQPARSASQRLADAFYGLLPIREYI